MVRKIATVQITLFFIGKGFVSATESEVGGQVAKGGVELFLKKQQTLSNCIYLRAKKEGFLFQVLVAGI